MKSWIRYTAVGLTLVLSAAVAATEQSASVDVVKNKIHMDI